MLHENDGKLIDKSCKKRFSIPSCESRPIRNELKFWGK